MIVGAAPQSVEPGFVGFNLDDDQTSTHRAGGDGSDLGDLQRPQSLGGIGIAFVRGFLSPGRQAHGTQSTQPDSFEQISSIHGFSK